MFFFSHFKQDQKIQIAKAIQEAELGSSGEIRVHVSYARKDSSLLDAAAKKFKELAMDQTKLRNGALLYINPRVKKFAVVGDVGIHEKVKQDFWDALAKKVTQAIQHKDPVHGVCVAVAALGCALKEHFPHDADDQNELSDEITESD